MTILDDLSFQLYSARFMGELEQQFEMLAALGYRKVEPYGGLFADVPRLQRLLTKYGMTAPTAHVGVDLWRADARATARICRDLGIDVAFAPAPPQGERDKDAEGWRTLGRELAEFGKRGRSRRPAVRLAQPSLGIRQGAGRQDVPRTDLRRSPRPALRIRCRMGHPRRCRSRHGNPETRRPAAWPATSRTWPRLANAWTRMAGRTPATAQWAGRICRDD